MGTFEKVFGWVLRVVGLVVAIVLIFWLIGAMGTLKSLPAAIADASRTASAPQAPARTAADERAQPEHRVLITGRNLEVKELGPTEASSLAGEKPAKPERRRTRAKPAAEKPLISPSDPVVIRHEVSGVVKHEWVNPPPPVALPVPAEPTVVAPSGYSPPPARRSNFGTVVYPPTLPPPGWERQVYSGSSVSVVQGSAGQRVERRTFFQQ